MLEAEIHLDKEREANIETYTKKDMKKQTQMHMQTNLNIETDREIETETDT